MSVDGRGFLVDAGTGRPTRVPIPNTWFKALTTDTNGAVTMCEYEATVDIPPHVHLREDESIYVLDGTLAITVGADVFEVGPRDFVFMPRGVPHSISVSSAPPVRFLATSTPGGFDHFMEDLAEQLAAGNDRSSPEVAAVRERHGWVPA